MNDRILAKAAQRRESRVQSFHSYRAFTPWTWLRSSSEPDDYRELWMGGGEDGGLSDLNDLNDMNDLDVAPELR